MKSRVIVALTLFTLGLTGVIDWIVFSTKKENESLGWEAFKIKYVEHLPGFLQPVYRNPLISTLILLVCFTIANVL